MSKTKSALLSCFSLAVLVAMPITAAHADSIFESEPNDDTATANGLVGNTNSLTAFGQIVDHVSGPDVDTFRFVLTSPGSVQINGFGSSSNSGYTLDNIVLFGLNDKVKGSLLGYDFGDGVRDGQLTLNNLSTGTYFAAISSGAAPNGSYDGTYRLEVKGINGGIVAGSPSPVPEASTSVSLGLMLLMGGAAFAARKRKSVNVKN